MGNVNPVSMFFKKEEGFLKKCFKCIGFYDNFINIFTISINLQYTTNYTDVLLQVGANSTAGNGRLLEIFTRECEDWTCRSRGYFRGRRSASANPLGLL